MVKKPGYIIMIVLFVLAHASAGAQAVSTLSENFDVACAAAGFPTQWMRYNPISATIPEGMWTCGSASGNGGTPGLQCTGYYSSTYHLDTAFLISPLLNLSSYSGKVYLQFDTRTSKVSTGARFSVVRAQYPDSNFHSAVLDSDLTAYMSPIITNQDSSGWVTHFVDITQFKGMGDMYMAFRYTSTATTGSIWYLDNVRTTATNGVPERTNINDALSIIGKSTSDRCTISFSSNEAAPAMLYIYDMPGKMVYKEAITMKQGRQEYTVNHPNLRAGTYFVKLENVQTFGVIRMVIW